MVGFIYYSDYQLGLSQGHLRVETSRVHCLGVQVAAVADVSVHSEGSFYAWITIGIPRPRVISPTPSVVLIINI